MGPRDLCNILENREKKIKEEISKYEVSVATTGEFERLTSSILPERMLLVLGAIRPIAFLCDTCQ